MFTAYRTTAFGAVLAPTAPTTKSGLLLDKIFSALPKTPAPVKSEYPIDPGGATWPIDPYVDAPVDPYQETAPNGSNTYEETAKTPAAATQTEPPPEPTPWYEKPVVWGVTGGVVAVAVIAALLIRR